MLASGEVSMLPTAEVEGQFVPQTKEEADAYRNLGFEGAMQMRDMQRSVTKGRNTFAKDYMMPVADAVMTAEGITSLPALGRLLYQGARSAPSAIKALGNLIKNPKSGIDLTKTPRVVNAEADAIRRLHGNVGRLIRDAGVEDAQAVQKLQMDLNKILMEAESIEDLQRRAHRALLRGEHEYFLDKVQIQEIADKIEDMYNYGRRLKLDRVVTEQDLAAGALDPRSSVLSEGVTKKYRGFKPIKEGSPQMNQSGGRINR